MSLVRYLVVVLLMSCAASACATHDARDGGAQKSAVSAETAAKFGEVTLPQGIQVLGTDADSGRGTRYRLALRMNDAQLEELLNQFPETPQPSDIPKSTQVIAGPPLSSAPAALYTQDQVITEDHGTVTRELIIDRRAPTEVYVHLSLYTT